MAISSELEQLLASWIPRQPWFPKLAADFGTDPDITPMSVARAFTYTAEELGGFAGLVTVISVGDGPTLRRLNIPLTLRGAEDMHLRHALIGRVDDLALGTVYVYDGAADPVFVNLMADAITKRKVFDGGQLSTESLRHSQEKTEARDRAPMPFPVTANGAAASANGSTNTAAEAVPPKPSIGDLTVGAEDVMPVEIRPIEVSDSGQHKSTVIIHDEYEPLELSFFRVLENGMPSSLTIPVLLTEAGSRSVPEVIGWGSGRWYDMFEVQEMEAPMALLSHVDVDAEPAWREAVNTVCAVDSGSIGAYNAHAAEMGRRIGELHTDMAAEFGVVEGAGEPTKQLVQKWVERIDWALGRAPLALDSLVPELRGHRARLQSMETIGTLQKIHGELTLDHVISSSTDGYSVVKFTDSTDSDPKPAAFDLVALLRSIDYAAGFARLQRTDALDSEDGSLVVSGFGNDPGALRAIFDSPEYLWASQVQNSLLSGYSRARGDSIGLSDPVLRAALVDRLLVEVVTELRNRPNWLSVPLATLTLVLKGKPARTEEAAEARLNWSDSGEAGSDAAEDSPASGDAAGADGGAGAESSDAEVASSDAFAVAPPADEATAADSESVSAAPRGTSGAVAAAIANSDSDDSGSEEPDAASGTDVPVATSGADESASADSEASESPGMESAADAVSAAESAADGSATNETEASETEADEVEVADTAENTVDAVADPDIDDVEDSTVVPPQDDAPEVAPAPAEDEEFVDEEESEAPVRRVPASFAARGATSEDADSTGHESQPAKPKDAPKLGHTWSERSQNSGSDRGTFGEQVSYRSDKSRDDAAARPDESSDKSGDDSKPAGGSVFDDLLGTERKRNRMKKRKKD
ncbi:maltokinase N-terminal cap-like domain-containing protein [Brevibacterium sediminis]|uniref:maltokinase N-terminal cap-like domain-containing protein n=1 Tax=Brevibacterium sediminis TaxID=1857024 RepID=UPI003B3BA658